MLCIVLYLHPQYSVQFTSLKFLLIVIFFTNSPPKKTKKYLSIQSSTPTDPDPDSDSDPDPDRAIESNTN